MNKITRIQFTIKLEDGSLLIRSFPMNIELPEESANLTVNYDINHLNVGYMNTQVTQNNQISRP